MRVLSSACAAASAALVLGLGPATAGEAVVAPVVDIAPVPVAPAPVSSWAGRYVGGSLGYSFGGEDEVGFDLIEGGTTIDRATGLGDLDVNGATAALHAGYRWQRGSWVFGPELSVEGGSVDDRLDFSVDDVALTAESKVNNIISLVAKTGYLLNPQTLVFGTFGVARIDADYRLEGDTGALTQDYNATGIAAGLGVERLLNPTTSVFAAYEYRDFGRTDVSFDLGIDTEEVRTVATPTHSNIKLGINFRF